MRNAECGAWFKSRLPGWTGGGTGPILLGQASFLLVHIANSGPVPLPAFPLPAFTGKSNGIMGCRTKSDTTPPSSHLENGPKHSTRYCDSKPAAIAVRSSTGGNKASLFAKLTSAGPHGETDRETRGQAKP